MVLAPQFQTELSPLLLADAALFDEEAGGSERPGDSLPG